MLACSPSTGVEARTRAIAAPIAQPGEVHTVTSDRIKIGREALRLSVVIPRQCRRSKLSWSCLDRIGPRMSLSARGGELVRWARRCRRVLPLTRLQAQAPPSRGHRTSVSMVFTKIWPMPCRIARRSYMVKLPRPIGSHHHLFLPQRTSTSCVEHTEIPARGQIPVPVRTLTALANTPRQLSALHARRLGSGNNPSNLYLLLSSATAEFHTRSRRRGKVQLRVR